MNKITILFAFLISSLAFSQQQEVNYVVNPCTFLEDDTITLTFDGASIVEADWGISNNALYFWSWSYDINGENLEDAPNNGGWTNSSTQLTYNNGTDTYSISFVPSNFFGRTGSIGRIGFLIKALDGTGDKKSQDILLDVGVSTLQLVLISPTANSIAVVNSGDNLNIAATNTCENNANYILKANNIPIDTQSNILSYSYTDINITETKNYVLEVTTDGVTKTKTFTVLVDPNTQHGAFPAGMVEGINYDSGDPTKATLVLDAFEKDFVYVAGSFNNWQPDANYAMKRDFSKPGRVYWLEITGLTPGQIETYQYWVVDKTPIANSPALVKTADPYSTLVLSPFDDPGIPASTYPNLPPYPTGQEREVTVLQTGKAAYSWVVPNFTKPKKEDLVVYQVLMRDFDQNQNYQDLIDKIDYFKNLNVTAIQLLPNMEFEGNLSWGYNTSFHMALDKYYGTEAKFKEFIDLCHQNGIAVILDVVLNHAFGRNPMNRMWMDDPDGDGWGSPSSENPYFNQVATHSYSVGEDFNHQQARTQNYVQRVLKHWIEEFKIDGFRWDLTKGFTQNCSPSNEGCTNSYQQDRVDILKEYADYAWSLDETHYVIFEHLGSDTEEQQWANYRIDEGKGIMMWGKMTDQYNQLTMGYASNTNISRMGHLSHGFTGKRVMGYPESHDEERLMYKNLQFGNSSGSYNVKDLNTALSRMSALGAVSLTIPGPKMIWHFADLGLENSIFTCNDGSVNVPGGSDGDCKLDTKPQPQWVNNWLGNPNRNQIYNDWSRLIKLKTAEAVFEGNYSIETGSSNLTPKIYIWDDALQSTDLKNVVILSNFGLSAQNITPNFPYIGTWYDLMDNTTMNITSTTASISLPAGQFRIFGNKASTLSTDDFKTVLDVAIYPNPTSTSFQINKAVESVSIFDLTGKLLKTYSGSFTKEHTFDVSTLPKSLYLVKAINNLGEVSTIKLIKT